jgi:hypothetical protein
MSFTFVTALYEIDRERHDSRSFKNYKEWFSKTLTIPVPMVIYTEEKNKELIDIIRKNLPTKVIYTRKEDIPFYNTVEKVKYIITESEFKTKILHPNALENRCFEYIPLINSKFVWMEKSIEQNYFNTDMFFWIDAGISRFMNFDISQYNFNTNLIKDIHENNKIYFQIGKEFELNDILKNPQKIDDYIGKTVNFIMAGFWGGNKSIIYDICNKSADNYINEYLNKNRVDNEQTLIMFVLPKYKEQLILIKNTYGIEYINYYTFCDTI